MKNKCEILNNNRCNLKDKWYYNLKTNKTLLKKIYMTVYSKNK